MRPSILASECHWALGTGCVTSPPPSKGRIWVGGKAVGVVVWGELNGSLSHLPLIQTYAELCRKVGQGKGEVSE